MLTARTKYAALVALMVVSHLALLWSVEYLPLDDLPLHIARAFILSHYHQVAEFTSTYIVRIQPLPNAGYFAILSPLMWVVTPLIAAKIFLSLTFLLFVAGCLILDKSLNGTYTWRGIACIPLFYSQIMLLGFINTVFGIGLFLLSFALWIRWREGWSPSRVCGMILLSVACYLAHLTSFGLLAAACTIWSFHSWLSSKSILTALRDLSIVAIAPVVIFVSYLNGEGTVGTIAYSSVAGKLSGMLGLFEAYSNSTTSLFWIVLVALLAWIYVVSIARDKQWRLPLKSPAVWVALGFSILYLLCPSILYTSWAADIRLVVPAAVLFVLSLKIRMDGRTLAVPATLLVLLSLARIAYLWVSWSGLSTQAERELAIASTIATGSRMFVIRNPNAWGDHGQRALLNTLDYAIVTRHARISSNLPLLSQSMIGYRVDPYSIENPALADAKHLDWPRIRRENDYVWIYRGGGVDVSNMSGTYTLLDSNTDAALYSLR